MKVGQNRVELFIMHGQSKVLVPIGDACHRGDHKSDASTNVTTQTILSLFLSSPRRVMVQWCL